MADAAYAGKELRNLPACVTWTTRLRSNAALHEPPPRTGRCGRPRVKGPRLPALGRIAAATAFTPVTVTRYRKTATVQAAVLTCLWHSVFGSRTVQVVLVRDRAAGEYDLALVTTDLDESPAAVIEQYAARWSIEVAFEDARQVFGAGQARNRIARAVRATIPFTLACQTLATIWYATAGHDRSDVAEHRARAPWYAAKAEPSIADMAAKLRRAPPRPDQPTPAEIRAIRLAWETPGA